MKAIQELSEESIDKVQSDAQEAAKEIFTYAPKRRRKSPGKLRKILRQITEYYTPLSNDSEALEGLAQEYWAVRIVLWAITGKNDSEAYEAAKYVGLKNLQKEYWEALNNGETKD